MRKFFALIITVFMILSIVACNGEITPNSGENNNTSTSSSSNSTSSDSHSHTYGEWSVVKEATCTEVGSKERVCSCGDKETESIEKIEHTYGKWSIVKEATCTEVGSKERVCSCGDKETESIEKIEHTYGKWSIVKEATCTKAGSKERACSCGSKESCEIASNGHSWNNATCVAAASCSICHVTDGVALGHTTDCGICNRCGIEYYSPYQLALKKLNEDYEKLQNQLTSLESSISLKESVLRSTMSYLGISYLNSKSYYNSQLNSIQSQLSDKQTQYTYALMAGNQTNVNRLQREISQLNEQYSTYYQAIQLCESQEEIDRLKDQYDLLKYSMESDYQRRLNEINKQYK